MIKKLTSIFLTFIIMSVFLPAAQAEFTEKILAIVNDEVITQSDVSEILSPIQLQYKSVYQGEDLEKKLAAAEEDILNQIIEDKLLLQEAKKQDLKVEEKEIEKLINDLKNNFQNEEEFRAVLDSQNVTVTDLKKRYTEQLLIKKIVEKEVLSKIAISPTEITEYYEQHKEKLIEPAQLHFRNIFIKMKNQEEETAKKINDIYEQLKKGVKFIELVEKYSEDPNVVNAGDMGYIKKGTMLSEIEKEVFSLNPGEFSKPVKTSSGYYIFKVEEKKDAAIPPLEEVQSKIQQRLYQQKVKEKFVEFMDKLKKQSFIEVKLNEEKS